MQTIDILEGLSSLTTKSIEVTKDILMLHFKIVTACIVGENGSKNWALVDTGLENSGEFIINSAEERFGKDVAPGAIILTHGHFDHVGSVKELLKKWDVPVYAHEKELPYLTGQKDYPVGDSTVDGGMVAELSPTFPHKAIDLGNSIHSLPSDGSVPSMPGWRWIPTPGHTEGHISLFRDSDRVLMVADAFTAVQQESMTSVMTQAKDVNGPPAYFTTDWDAAEASVKRLRDLNPSLAIFSHGMPMEGEDLRSHLENLANNFERIAIPEDGRFVKQ